jgi:hypothetical protein
LAPGDIIEKCNEISSSQSWLTSVNFIKTLKDVKICEDLKKNEKEVTKRCDSKEFWLNKGKRSIGLNQICKTIKN